MKELFEEDNSFVEDSNQSKKLNMMKLNTVELCIV